MVAKMVPIHSRGSESLKEVFTFGIQAMTSEKANGISVDPIFKKLMTKRIHPIAVDISDGAIGSHIQVTGNQTDTDHGSGLQVAETGRVTRILQREFCT